MKYISAVAITAYLLIIVGCGGGGSSSSTPPMGDLSVLVVAAEPTDPSVAEPIEGASIDIYDENASFVARGTTDASGSYVNSLSPGTYTIKVAAQSFRSSPSRGVSAVPFEIVNAGTVDREVALDQHDSATATAKISGNADAGGMLVVAVDETTGYEASSLTDDNGNYTLFNVEPGEYMITAYQAGYLSDEIAVTVVSDAFLEGKDLTVSENTNVSLSGTVTFLAGANGVIDITLLHPETLDSIPGLTTSNVSESDGSYQLQGVPPGEYLAWATFDNDGYVMDQDWVIKNGGFPAALEVTISDSNQVKDFSITDSVPLTSPTNEAKPVIPVEVTTLTPTLTWQSYPGTKYWAIEVFDSDGNSIWGGFDGVDTINHDSIAKETLSIEFNFDSSASESLEDGKVYRWKVLSLKDGTGDDAGTLIVESASEDQLGLFKVVLP